MFGQVFGEPIALVLAEEAGSFVGIKERVQEDKTNPLLIDYNTCLLCRLCFRVGGEVKAFSN